MSSKIRIVRTPGDDQEFRAEFLELTGVEYPPKSRNQWMDILLTAGFSQQEARQFLQYDGYPELAHQDVSCLAADGNPTFTQSLMEGLRLRYQSTLAEYTPEIRPPGDWMIILTHLHNTLGEPIPGQTWRNWTRGKAPKIRILRENKFAIRVHLDHFPPNLKSESLRAEFLEEKKSEPN